MVRCTKEVFTGKTIGSPSTFYREYAGLSTDTKPTDTGISTGSLFLEVDTGDIFVYDEAGEQWNKIASLEGSGD